MVFRYENLSYLLFKIIEFLRREFSRVRVFSGPVRETFEAARDTAVFQLTDEGERIRIETPVHAARHAAMARCLTSAYQHYRSAEQCRTGERIT